MKIFECNALDCFEVLTDEERDGLQAHTTSVKYSKGEVIIKQGFTVSSIFFLSKGIVRLDVASDNRTSTIALASGKSFLGLMCSFDTRQVDFSVVALVDSEIQLIDRDFVERLIQENGKFATRLIYNISSMTKELVNSLIRKNAKNSDGAVAMTLLELMKHFGSSQFDLPLSRVELAAVVGYSKESLLLSLSSLSSDGIITLNGKNVVINDDKRLLLVAQNG